MSTWRLGECALSHHALQGLSSPACSLQRTLVLPILLSSIIPIQLRVLLPDRRCQPSSQGAQAGG